MYVCVTVCVLFVCFILRQKNSDDVVFFTEDADKKELCKVTFKENDLQLLRDAIEDLYYFEFVIGNKDKIITSIFARLLSSHLNCSSQSFCPWTANLKMCECKYNVYIQEKSSFK